FYYVFFLFSALPRPPSSTLFPYTTLFRSLAAETFVIAPDNCACLQARLLFHNDSENWLTRQFAIEYACHFELLLPMLASLNLPVPLGGTSNHFRTSILRSIGAWDPHNVTEDADLGLRLARAGYLTGMIDAATFEAAHC